MSAKREAYEKALNHQANLLKDIARELLKADPTSQIARQIFVFTNNLVDLALTEDRKLRFACAQAYKQIEEDTDDGENTARVDVQAR